MSALRLELPDELLEMLVDRVADRVIERLAEERAGGGGEELGPWLTVEQAARYIGSSPGRIYNLRSSGRLSRHGAGRKALISRAELDALIVGDRVAQALPMGPRSRSRSGRAS